MTTDQLTLPIAELIEPTYTPEATIQERFEAWIAVNTWVIPKLEELVTEWLDAGHKRVGMKQVWEVLRWSYGKTTGDPFKANNDYTSRAARLLIDRHPEWADAIETRVLRAA